MATRMYSIFLMLMPYLVFAPSLHAEEVDNWRDTIVVRWRGDVRNFDVKQGEWVARPYMLVRPYSEGVAVAVANEDGKEMVDGDQPKVYVDLSGNLALPGRFEDAYSFREGRALVAPDGGRAAGVIDTRGQWVIKPMADFGAIDEASGGAISLFEMKGEGFVAGWADLDGVILGKFNQVEVERFHHGLAFAWDFERAGYVDQAGEWRIRLDPRIEGGPFSNGLAMVRIWDEDAGGDRGGYIDMGGKFVVEPRFRYAGRFSNGLACVQREDKTWIYIDRRGEQAFLGEFDMARTFHDRRAAVRVEGKWGYINTEGKMVVEPQYDSAYDFIDGYAEVHRSVQNEDGQFDRYRGWIDRDGEVVIPIKEPASLPF